MINRISETLFRKLAETFTLSSSPYYDHHVKSADELPTIGIMHCAEKNHAVVELALPVNSNIFASKYQLYLPSKSELQAELESITAKLAASGELRRECDE